MKASYIKRVLITTSKDLKEVIDQRKNQQISILVKESFKTIIKKSNFEIQKDNELRIDLKHLVYYMLLWIACVDDYYNIYKVLKKKTIST